MADYVPDEINEFDDWQNNWVTYATANAAVLLLDAAKLAAINAAKTRWRTARDNRLALETPLRAATQEQTSAQGAYEAILREESQVITRRSTTTNEHRAGLKITVPDQQPTPAGPPTTAPVLSVDTSQRLRHVVHFARTQAEGGGRAKPPNVRGMQLWMRIVGPAGPAPIGGGAPIDEADLTFVIEDPRTPHTIDFPATDGGKTVEYWGRWVNRRGEVGPWAQIVSATIVA